MRVRQRVPIQSSSAFGRCCRGAWAALTREGWPDYVCLVIIMLTVVYVAAHAAAAWLF